MSTFADASVSFVAAPPGAAALRPSAAPRCTSGMAGLEGFEPPTPGFGDRCSSRTELQACTLCAGRPAVPWSRHSARAAPTRDTSGRELLPACIRPTRAERHAGRLLPRLLVLRVLATERTEL